MTRKKNSYPRNSFEIPEDITTVFIKVRRYYVPVYTLPQKPEVNKKAIADSCGKLEYILESMQTLSHYDESDKAMHIELPCQSQEIVTKKCHHH